MKSNISCFVLLDSFEDGWEFDDWNYDDLIFSYFEEVLYIPESKIKEYNYSNGEVELILNDLNFEDISDDWYINLRKISKDIYNI